MAEEVADCRSFWGFWSRLAEANCMDIPEELENTAERLLKIPTQGLAEWSPQREAILDLLNHVRSSTGRYHYAEVSTLINAERVWRALKNRRPIPELSHDVDSFKMIVQRHNKRVKKQAS